MDPISTQRPSALTQQATQDIAEQPSELEAMTLAHHDAIDLVLDVPFVRETLVETFKNSENDFRLKHDTGVAGGSLNPNLSGHPNELLIPQGATRLQTAAILARQIGFAHGKAKFLEEMSPQPGETRQAFVERYTQECLRQVVIPGYEFEHAFLLGMRNNHSYRPREMLMNGDPLASYLVQGMNVFPGFYGERMHGEEQMGENAERREAGFFVAAWYGHGRTQGVQDVMVDVQTQAQRRFDQPHHP